MNIFSNIGVTELLLILLLALLVVGPERLPEMGRKLGSLLRDARRAYDNLTRDLGPELASLQKSTQELRESFDSVRSIPEDMVQSVVRAAELDETLGDLKGMADEVGQVRQTLSTAGKVLKDPMDAAVSTAQSALLPKSSEQERPGYEESAAEKAADLSQPEREQAADQASVLPEGLEQMAEPLSPVAEQPGATEQQAVASSGERDEMEAQADARSEDRNHE